jgi:hypothetical protein
VRLGSDQGASVELEVLGYEFPRANKRTDGWPANWLDILGRVRLADGSTWDFTHPCLTTFEAAQLGSWLHNIYKDDQTALSRVDTHPKAPRLFFTEPLLAFEAEPASKSAIVISVTLNLEALPPWETWEERIGEEDFVVTVAVTRQDIDRAVVQWTQACARFPER